VAKWFTATRINRLEARARSGGGMTVEAIR